MITAYAQASDREGLDAAVNGRTVGLDDAGFSELREKGAALNMRSKPRQVGSVTVRRGQGVVRLELPGNEDNAAGRSPIVVVIGVDELHADSAAATRRVLETVTAIGRQCNTSDIDAGLEIGRRIGRTTRRRATVGVVATILLAAIAVLWIVRACSESASG